MKRRDLYVILIISSLFLMLFSVATFADSTGTIVLTQPDSTHVYFGSYPQTEIVAQASQCGTYGKEWGKSTDYIVNATLYNKLQSASWNSNGDATVDGTKYHRIKKDNARHSISSDYYYNWTDSTTYHYFRYDPIKWRILKMTDTDAFLFCDTAIDEQKYDSSYTSVTWETSIVRNWLNNDFISRAFTSEEASAIKTTEVVNANNVNYGTSGGNDTRDKVFLLSENEVYGKDAVQYGFASSYNTYDKARQLKSSTYAKAMGEYAYTSSSYLGNCNWWLRSPGSDSNYAAYVYGYGNVYQYGNLINGYNGICPALHLNLKSKDPITIEYKKKAQTISSISNQTKTYGCAAFSLKASAKTKLTYSSGNRNVSTVSTDGIVTIKNPGTAKITIKAAENDTFTSATKTITITVKLKKPTLSGKALGGKKAKLTWSKVPGRTKYQVYYYQPSKGKYVLVSSRTKNTIELKVGKKGKAKFKVRAYRTVSGKKVYSAYSAVKSIKIR